MKTLITIFLTLAAAWATVATLADDIRTERITFDRGANSAVIEASITGYEVVDYILGARAGQHMNVSMATDNLAGYFNILPPGEDDLAMFIGSTRGNQYEGILPSDGDYRIRVYMMRSAARRNEVANYRIEMVITAGDSAAATGRGAPDTNTATRAGTGDFDATGRIPCAQHAGQPMASCRFGVAREAGGNATVVITRPDGSSRAIFFADGRASSADTGQADGYPEFSVNKTNDLNTISIGDERYEIPDAVVFGG